MKPATRTVLIAIGVGALAVRLAAAIATGGLWTPEVNEYHSLGRALLAGQGFIFVHTDVLYRSYAPPMHAWLTAASYLIGGSLVPLMLLQAMAGAALAATTAAIAVRLFGGWFAGAMAGALVALHPGLVVYAAMKAHPLTFDALFFVMALLQTVRVAERPSVRRAALLGLIIGVGALSRGTIVIFLPVIGIWLLVRTPFRSWLGPVRLGLVAGLCAAAVIAPWTIRNSLLHGRFVFLLTTDAEDFWRGNNPWATGSSYTGARPIMEALPPEVLQEIRSQPGELAQADWYREHAREFIRDNPRRVVELTLTKFYQFWWFAPESGVLYPRWWLWAYKAYYVGVLVLATAGVRSVPRTRAAAEQFVVIAAFLLALSGLQSLFYVEVRHRWAVEPLVLVLSGGGAAALVRRKRAAHA